MRKRLFMRKVRRTLTSTAFMSGAIGALCFMLCFNLLWMGTHMEFLKVCAFALFAGMAGFCGYACLTEDPRDKYLRVNHE